MFKACFGYAGIGKGIGNMTGHKKHGKKDEETNMGWAGLHWQMLLGWAGWAWQAGLGWLVGWAGGLTGWAGQPAI